MLDMSYLTQSPMMSNIDGSLLPLRVNRLSQINSPVARQIAMSRVPHHSHGE